MFVNIIVVGENIKKQISKHLVSPDVTNPDLKDYLEFIKINPSSYHANLDTPRNELKGYNIIYSKKYKTYGYYSNPNGVFLNYDIGYPLLYMSDIKTARLTHTSYNYSIDWSVTMEKSNNNTNDYNKFHYLLSNSNLYNLTEVSLQDLLNDETIIKPNSVVTILLAELDD